ncbi:hypothetical protein [Herbaspirillum sp. meg3]|nr:hypothetical protein [Herbaspirillum sp. meg3]
MNTTLNLDEEVLEQFAEYLEKNELDAQASSTSTVSHNSNNISAE